MELRVNNRRVVVVSAYNPKPSSHFLNDIQKLSSSFFFIIRDFNAHHTNWNCYNNNTVGNTLYNHQLQNNYYIYYTNDHTRISNNSIHQLPSTVDLILSNSTVSIRELKTHKDDLNSDHVPVTFVLNDRSEVSTNKIKEGI